ncbi:MAG: Demethylmenaquinone methyltransferase [Chlamydiae bacterium]|nr:Demethylmenaquinone methyltransferase [Chlamydiota bacterium]
MLDIATGTGEVLIQALNSGKVNKAVGIDLAEKMLAIAENKQKKLNLNPKISFQKGNALNLDFKDNTFDCTSISFGIRNVQNVPLALKEMHRVLKPNGRSLILEFSLPKNYLLKQLHLIYLRTILPKVGALFSKSKQSYVYLNKTIETFPYGTAFLQLLSEAGFKSPKAFPLLGGIATLYQADKC